MTVHTMRQITALQRANARWKQRQPQQPQLHLVHITPVRQTRWLDRIAALGDRLENSRWTWRVLFVCAVVGYVAFILSHWPTP